MPVELTIAIITAVTAGLVLLSNIVQHICDDHFQFKSECNKKMSLSSSSSSSSSSMDLEN